MRVLLAPNEVLDLEDEAHSGDQLKDFFFPFHASRTASLFVLLRDEDGETLQVTLGPSCA